VFAPEIVELPEAWPACRTARCGSTVAIARIDAPYGPVTIVCENGHYRGYRARDEFRARGRYAGRFSAAVVAPNLPRYAPERRLEPGVRRREDVLDDADRCALCGTPPAQHPLHDEPALRSDREVWSWLQRWRPAVYAQLLEALAIVRQHERVTFGNWRLKIPPALRDQVVHELGGSTLQTDHLIPPVRLLPLLDTLTPRELDFGVNRLLLAVCRRCDDGRWAQPKSRDDYLRDYTRAFYAGDERRARAAAAPWRTMEKLAAAAARATIAGDERTA
jgi:hypothetical protein